MEESHMNKNVLIGLITLVSLCLGQRALSMERDQKTNSNAKSSSVTGHNTAATASAALPIAAQLSADQIAKNNALFLASENGNLSQVKLALLAGAQLNARNSKGRTAVALAVLHGHFAVVKFLCEEKGADFEIADNDGATPVKHAACERNVALWFADFDIIQFLIERGANLNAADKDGITPFCGALQERNHPVVNLLLQSLPKINLDVEDNQGNTPIILALKRSDVKTIEKLIYVNKKIIYKVNKKGESALSLAQDKKVQINATILENSKFIMSEDIKHKVNHVEKFENEKLETQKKEQSSKQAEKNKRKRAKRKAKKKACAVEMTDEQKLEFAKKMKQEQLEKQRLIEEKNKIEALEQAEREKIEKLARHEKNETERELQKQQSKNENTAIDVKATANSATAHVQINPVKGFTIEFSDAARHQINQLEPSIKTNISNKLNDLKAGDQTLDIKKLKNTNRSMLRIRIGDYRVIYEIKNDERKIAIIVLGHRSVIYQMLDKMEL